MLAIGTTAPDFELASSGPEKIFKLSAMQGRRVIIIFYPADWTPVCTSELSIYNEALDFFKNQKTAVVGLSVDSVWCHIAFSGDRKFDFPLLADFEPKGAVAKNYNVYDHQTGECKRALYLIDENGIIRWNYLSDRDVNPGISGVLQALDDLNNKE
jgi:peroxiredoxin